MVFHLLLEELLRAHLVAHMIPEFPLAKRAPARLALHHPESSPVLAIPLADVLALVLPVKAGHYRQAGNTLLIRDASTLVQRIEAALNGHRLLQSAGPWEGSHAYGVID